MQKRFDSNDKLLYYKNNISDVQEFRTQNIKLKSDRKDIYNER